MCRGDRLDPEDLAKRDARMFALLRQGLTQSVIAARFGVTIGTVRDAVGRAQAREAA